MRGVGKNYWALTLLILAGIVLGSFIATLTAGLPGLGWLSFGQTFGFQIQLYQILG